MPTCEPWTLVRVPFPYADRPVVPHRPALVIAAPASADGLPVLWVAMVTSAAHRPAVRARLRELLAEILAE